MNTLRFVVGHHRYIQINIYHALLSFRTQKLHTTIYNHEEKFTNDWLHFLPLIYHFKSLSVYMQKIYFPAVIRKVPLQTNIQHFRIPVFIEARVLHYMNKQNTSVLTNHTILLIFVNLS